MCVVVRDPASGSQDASEQLPPGARVAMDLRYLEPDVTYQIGHMAAGVAEEDDFRGPVLRLRVDGLLHAFEAGATEADSGRRLVVSLEIIEPPPHDESNV
jgi:hypothetical protein